MHGAGGAWRQTADPGGGPLPARPCRHVQEGGPGRSQPVPLRASRRSGHPPLPPGGPVQGWNSSTAFFSRIRLLSTFDFKNSKKNRIFL